MRNTFTFRQNRRYLLLLALGLGGIQSASAQREVRHLSAVTAAVGTTKSGTYYQLGYSRFISDKTRFDVAPLVEFGPRGGAPSRAAYQLDYRAYELGIGISPRLLHLGETVYLRLPLQLRSRYERSPAVGGKPDWDGFSVGPSVGVAGDIYLIDRLSLYGEARLSWLFIGTVEEKFPRYFGGGIALHLGM